MRKHYTTIPASNSIGKQIHSEGSFLPGGKAKLGCTSLHPLPLSVSIRQQATELVLSNYKSEDPQRRQWTCVDLHQVKMRLEEYKTAAVTLGFGLDSLELIMMEIGSISFFCYSKETLDFTSDQEMTIA